MPKVRITKEQRTADYFNEIYRTGRARTRLAKRDLYAPLHMSNMTLYKREKDPCKYLTLGEIATLGAILGWSDAEILHLVHTAMGKLENKPVVQ